jgi:hypothetical protein
MLWLRTWWDWVFPWRRDARNPYRRHCKHCGQQQDLHAVEIHEELGWWENMGRVNKCPRMDHGSGK